MNAMKYPCDGIDHPIAEFQDNGHGFPSHPCAKDYLAARKRIDEFGDILWLMLAVCVEEDEDICLLFDGVFAACPDSNSLAHIYDVRKDHCSGFFSPGFGLVAGSIIDNQNHICILAGLFHNSENMPFLIFGCDDSPDRFFHAP